MIELILIVAFIAFAYFMIKLGLKGMAMINSTQYMKKAREQAADNKAKKEAQKLLKKKQEQQRIREQLKKLENEKEGF